MTKNISWPYQIVEVGFLNPVSPLKLPKLADKIDQFYERVKDKPTQVLERYNSKIKPKGLLGRLLMFFCNKDRKIRYAATQRALFEKKLQPFADYVHSERGYGPIKEADFISLVNKYVAQTRRARG